MLKNQVTQMMCCPISWLAGWLEFSENASKVISVDVITKPDQILLNNMCILEFWVFALFCAHVVVRTWHPLIELLVTAG